MPSRCRHCRCWRLSVCGLHASTSLPPFPPGGFASRPSRGHGRIGTMRAPTPAEARPEPGRSLPLTALCRPDIPSPITSSAPTSLSQSLSARWMVIRASPYGGRLAAKCRRIGFVNLQAAGSSPVALHPASRRRSYSRLRTPRQRATGTHTPLTKRPHGRTPTLLRRPWALAHSARLTRRSSGNRWSAWSVPAAILRIWPESASHPPRPSGTGWLTTGVVTWSISNLESGGCSIGLDAG